MASYKYTECGLDNVIIEGVTFVTDDHGERVVSIKNINGLHKVIAQSILSRKSGMTGKELRFLRTEMGMTQAELAALVHREPLTVSRWERGEIALDANAETIIRLAAIEVLKVQIHTSVKDVSMSCVPSAHEQPIGIDGSDPKNYRPQPIAA